MLNASLTDLLAVLDGGNIRACRCNVGARKTFPISLKITASVALAAIFVAKSI